MDLQRENERLSQILNLEVELFQVKDLDILLERILSGARLFAKADAGSIYTKEKDVLHFKYTQNDTLQRRLEFGKKLIYSTFSIPINTRSIAGYVAFKSKIVNIEDAYKISQDRLYSFDNKFDKLSGYTTKSMLTLPLETSRNKLIGVLQLINAMDDNHEVISFSHEEEPFIKHFAISAANALERAQMTRAILLRMIKMIELHDPNETGAHVNRVGAYAAEIYETWALKRGIAPDEVNRQKDVLRMASMLHDIGKIAITDRILKKPAKLSDEEYFEMKLHTVLGAKVFEDTWSDFDEAAYEIALNHHEKWDGKGYPGHINPFTGEKDPRFLDHCGHTRGKQEEEIPLFARIVSVADVYDALSSKRSYKDPWPEEKVLNLIKEDSGKHFDPTVVEAFLSCIDVLRNIYHRYTD
jgi:response regulator RpfG family c-di-GMP phosphodiesterase